jgi:hypothetical protein
LAQAMRQLMDDPDRRAELGRRGREFVLSHCRAEDMAAYYTELFCELTFVNAERAVS